MIVKVKFDRRARIGLFEISLLIFAIFAFAFIMSEVPRASAVERLLSDDSIVDVEQQSDGRWVDSEGRLYVQNDAGRLEPQAGVYTGNELVSRNSASSTPNPTGAPTGVTSPVVFAPSGINPASAGGTGAVGAGSDPASALGTMAGSMSQFGGLIKGPIGEALIWGGVMFGAGMAVSSVLGGSKSFVEAVSIAAAAGGLSAKLIEGFFGVSPLMSMAIGAGIGFLVFMLIYEETMYQAVTFQCMPWQAPIGATDDICETCNEEGRPCSDYRCKSLGQTCELVNPGKKEEMCVNINPKDVSPPVIKPYEPELTKGYKYAPKTESPPGPGINIVRVGGENECIEAFTPLRFGVETNEPAQCKIDFNSTTSFDAMFSFMGRSNLFKYIHYEQLVLPYAKDMGNSSLQIQNGQDLTLYIRCRDKLGNSNEAEYAVNFCVDPSPDTTAPVIRMTSMDDGGCIPATTDSAVVEFYVNEPSQCRWSRDDQSYDLMNGDMQCSREIFQMNAMQLYTCRANLTGITKDLTDFYVRCQDLQSKPVNDRNTNQESYRFSLRGSNQLKLRSIGPNGTIPGGVSPMPVTLEVETLFGCEKGRSSCYFSSDGAEGDYILFANTDSEDGLHNQTLYLTQGQHEYYVKCVDSGGNLILNSTSFFLDIDTSSPIIARIYNDDGQLKIVTLRDSECSYSYDNCDFLFEEGMKMPKDDSLVHFAEWNNKKTYYIKCRDKYRDLTADCSAVVKPTKLIYDEE